LGLSALRSDLGPALARQDEPLPLLTISRPAAAATLSEHADALSALVRRFVDILRALVIVEDAAQVSESLKQRYQDILWVTQTPELTRRLGVGSDALVLVRPDGVIGYSGTTSDIIELSTLLDQEFVSKQASALSPQAELTTLQFR
jgi:hypothetical protein